MGRTSPRSPAKSSKALALAAWLLAAQPVWAQGPLWGITDNTSYNVGSVVRLKINPAGIRMNAPVPLEFAATLRYSGDPQPLLGPVAVADSSPAAGAERPTEYRDFWKIPPNARTGRYEVELVALDSKSHRPMGSIPAVATFSVYRKPLRIERIDLDRTFYTSGDRVACRVTLKNLSDRPLSGLRVEFSDRYWPWLALSSKEAGPKVVPLAEGLSLPPGAGKEVASASAAVAEEVKRPAVHQYAVVVWDQERKNIYDIAFSALVFIRPPALDSPRTYPLQYLFPQLADLDFSAYRRFYPAESLPWAIEFDHAHTMFAPGSTVETVFSVRNPTPRPWRGASVRARLVGPDGKEIQSTVLAKEVVLEPQGPPAIERVGFTLPAGPEGIYRAEVEVRDPSDEVIASNVLELGVNTPPKSILIFCAHQDDEMAHAGIIRAAVENHIPIHVVYFTGGDAGSCDRYYQHSCDPAEALDFGALRMEEARAALAHLGLPRDNIHFLGLPDGGLGQIWFNHREASNPYLSVLLASDHAPYSGLVRANLPYARTPVVELVKGFIKEYRPEVIYTGHPDERHVDHRTNNWLVVKALQELLREGAVSADQRLLVDQVYGPGPQTPAPYRYEKRVLNVSGEVMVLAQEAGWFYQSQGGNRQQGHLRTFSELRREEVHWQVVDWKDHEGWNERAGP